MIQELDCVALNESLPDQGLGRDDLGTVVFCYEGGDSLEVEFVTSGGGTFALLTLSADRVRAVSALEIDQRQPATTERPARISPGRDRNAEGGRPIKSAVSTTQ